MVTGVGQKIVGDMGQREVRQREAARGLARPSKLEHTLIFGWRGRIWVHNVAVSFARYLGKALSLLWYIQRYLIMYLKL